MKVPYLGKINLHWCQKCNVPVLAKKCGACDGITNKLEITPPGDIRPAFEEDIKIINKAVIDQYGGKLVPQEKIVLLNSVPGFDRFDEIIMDGAVVGALKFDVKTQNYIFLPRLKGAQRVITKHRKGCVNVARDAAEFIMKGKSLLMPGVIDFDLHIKKGDEVIILCEDRVIGVGRARFSGEDTRKLSKGMFVKVRKHITEMALLKPWPAGGQNQLLLLKANEKVIQKIEKEALNFIERTISGSELPVVVSYSGGKDSLATLLLVRKKISPKVMFIDTGVEFPETLEHISDIVKDLDLELIIGKAGERFWKGLRIFGMSGRDYRWCCKVCKLGPVAKVMDGRFPEGFLNFVGQRRYESEIRARSGRVWRNSWLPKQLSASPIQNWNALQIWMFLFKEGIPTNPLYKMGFERIGCWVCPSSSLSEIKRFTELHPDLWNHFESSLKESGFGDEDIRSGFWRWRNLPKGQKTLREELGINKARIISKPKVGKKNIQKAQSLSKALKIDCSEDIILRASFCLDCGICLAQCDHDAIDLSTGSISILEHCKGCGKCQIRCPLVKFIYDYNYN